MAKLAVIKTGGKQYVVKEGDRLKVEKFSGQGTVGFGDVLLVAETDGSSVEVGNPKTKAKVTANVVAHGRADKIRVVHYKAKVRYHKVYGHRQPFTQVKIEKIS